MKQILDLNIVPTHNIKTIGIADMSIYASDVIIGATIEITPPNFSKVAAKFFPHEVNVFNSNTLKLSNVMEVDELLPLPDGIWRLKYSIQPATSSFVMKKFFRTEQIQCKYDNIFLSLDLNDECLGSDSYCLPQENRKKNQYQRLREIELMINGAISAANKGEDEYAMQLYKRADNLLTNFSNCKTCK